VKYRQDYGGAAFCRALDCFVHHLCSVPLQNVTDIILYSIRGVLAGVYDIEDGIVASCSEAIWMAYSRTDSAGSLPSVGKRIWSYRGQVWD
jgi:hypothetical protein